MIKRTIVLGAGGFLGRAVSRALSDDPRCNPVIQHLRRPPAVDVVPDDSTMWRALDLVQASPAEIRDLIDQSGADVVVNCIGATFGTAAEMRASNIDVVVKLIEALRDRPHIHLVHLGSAAEYGAHWPGRAITETAAAKPVSEYGITKLESTELLVDAGRSGDLSVTILRVFNPFGRGSAERTLPGRAAREIDAALRRNDDVVRLGSLESWRDYIDTRDVASAVVAAVASVPSGAKLLNVGRGEAVLTRDLVNSLAIIAGYHGQIMETDDGSSRSSPVPWQQADITTTSSWLGWTPQYTIDASLRDLWSSIRQGVPA